MNDPTVRAITCANCGAVSTPGENFCRYCGKQLLAPTIAATPPPVPNLQSTAYRPVNAPPAKKKRSKLMMGCLIFIGLMVVGAGAAGIYIWRATTYTPPVRKAPDIPERASGTLLEFPVDNDKNAPARPTSVQTESLTNAKAMPSSPTKLPPGVDRSRLSKGATSMTSATYRPPPRTQNATRGPGSMNEEIYICVLTAMPNESTFGDDLAKLVTGATSGQQKPWGVKSQKGPEYKGWQINSSQANVYVLTKQGGDIVILIYAPDPAMQSVVDRLAQNVGNGNGLNDYPEVKDALWTLPASTPGDLTLLEISSLSRAQLENSFTGGDFDKGRSVPGPRGTWARLGPGDCTGKDIDQSIGSAQPDPDKCTTNGTFAICWDGNQYRSPGRAGAWCTYKNTGGAPCRGGGNTGMAYQCRDVSARTSVARREEPTTGGEQIPSEMRAFIPDRLSSARYLDSAQHEWTALNFEYGSSFQAWRTWLLARGALGLSGAQTTTVRDVNGLYIDQEGKRILVFQKGPYLIFLSAPSSSPLDRIVALGNQFQV